MFIGENLTNLRMLHGYSRKPQKVKSIIDLVVKKGIIDIRGMADNDWMVDVDFLHRITGIDLGFFNRYLIKEHDFVVKVNDFSSVR